MQKTETAYMPLESSLINVFDQHQKELFDASHPKVSHSRAEAIEFLKEKGLPTRKNEKWKNSPFPKQYEKDYLIDIPSATYDKNVNEIFHCEVHGFEAHTYSLLNGWYYSPEEKQLETLENGVVVGSMRKAQSKYPELFAKYYGTMANHQQDGFAAANTALFRDGIFIYVPDDVEVENTMQLIKMINREEPLMVHSRNLIILGKNSKLTFMHCDDSVNHYSSFINTLTEVYINENAYFDLYKLQNINDNTSLLNNTFFQQERNSRLRVNVLSLNGGKIRNELHVDLMGEYAEADLNGVYLMDKQQHIDNQVFVNHAKPNCYSNELFKGVLDEEASGIFNGYIFVARDAQKTNAFQRNNNILMTPKAVIDTMPFLEIYADDVKCSHGATIGQLDNEAMFYLMQRGISKADSRLLLMYAFLAEVTTKVSIDALRNNYEDMIKRRLRGELSICERCVLHCSTPDKPVEFEIDMSKI
ncbi:MAG: Fe-S cluster assembly protein SufD [Bacteroidetes bacterium]|nr:Fe-S cluster assembly protein SufD [Bacteroidota bacterium]